MKVLQLGRYFPPHIGGTENVMYDLAIGASSSGHTCDVLCCSDDNHFIQDKFGDVTVFRTKTLFKSGSISFSIQQIGYLNKISSRYDIIHIHHPAPIATIALFFVRPNSKIVVTWHSDIVKQKNLLRFYKPLQDWLLKRANVIVATTPSYILGSVSLKKYPSKTIHIPLGIAEPKESSSNSSNLKDRYFGKKIVFSLGRLVEYKGYTYLIEAAKYLDDSYVILIGGNGPLRDPLMTQIINDKLESKVHLLGRIEDNELPDYYRFCDVFCLPSITKNEAFGLVIAEAMSYSKPIIATKIPGSGVDWVNQDGLTGINVPVMDSQTLAKAISRVCEDQALKERFSNESFRRYVDLFSKKKMINAYLNLYTEIFNLE